MQARLPFGARVSEPARLIDAGNSVAVDVAAHIGSLALVSALTEAGNGSGLGPGRHPSDGGSVGGKGDKLLAVPAVDGPATGVDPSHARLPVRVGKSSGAVVPVGVLMDPSGPRLIP
ncbi:MAG: hypothetical protein EB127_15080, partial [Alphaproteobacteria bacterium]|nr:hypothetical protein [Alphaproteobacteria bacterium]